MREHEQHDALRLGLGQRELTGPALRVAATGGLAFGAPVAGIVAVQIEPADAVLVEATVAVAVDALGVRHVIAAPGTDVPQQAAALVHRVDDRVPLAGADELPHVTNEPVTVEVLTGVFVQQPVAVVVLGTDRAAVRLRR